MTMSLERLERLAAAALFAGLVGACLLAGGCLAFDPGGQSARSLDQRFKVLWEGDTIRLETRGPHEAAWEVAGGDLVLTKDADGNIVVDPLASELNYWLRYYPSAAIAGAVSPVYAEQSTAQMEYIVPPLTQVITRIIEAWENMALKPEPPPGP